MFGPLGGGLIRTHQGLIRTHQGLIRTQQGLICTHQGPIRTHQGLIRTQRLLRTILFFPEWVHFFQAGFPERLHKATLGTRLVEVKLT